MATNLERQQQRLNELDAELGNLKKDQSIAEQQSKGGLLKKPNLTSVKGKDLLAKFKEASRLVNAKQAEYNALEKIINDAKAKSKIVSDVGSDEEALKAAKAGLSVEEYRTKTQADLKKSQDEQNKAAGIVVPINTGNVPLEDFIKNLDSASADDVNKIKKYLGIKKLDGKLDYATVIAIYAKEKEIETLADATGRAVDRVTYYQAGDGGAGGPTLGGTISSPTGAADLIESAIKTELGRTPSAAERKELTEKLNAAERKNPSKTIKGITTQGLDKEQFLREEVRKIVDPTTGKSEYENKKVQKRSVTTQSLLTTINANGLKIPQSQIDTWSKSVENGTDINIVNNQIRDIAANGMPQHVKDMLKSGINLETVYSPYRTAMASVLEIPSSAISLNDPSLRLALGPDKEMTMYDYQKALRKDTRWQYTNNAKEDVFDSVNKVLKDFGLQG